MKIRPWKLICLVATLIWGTLLHAGAQGPPQGPPPSPIVEALDRNEDQQLSSREIRNATKALLKLDKDNNGSLSESELKPKPKRERRRRKNESEEERPKPPKPPLLSALDTDQSGDLSKAEILNAAEALIALDRDEDGALSSDEAGLKRPERGNAQGSPGQGGGGRPGPPPRR